MSKILKKISTAIVLSSVLIAPVFAQGINIVINNKKVETPDAPYIKEERTLVPLRLISENLGINVDWDNTNRQVVLKKSSGDILLPIQKDYYLVNGQRVSTEISGEIKNDRTFVPVRLIAELFDRNVGWDNNTKTVLINDKGQTPAPVIKSTNTFEKAKVLRVVDGDTIEIDRGKGKEKVRFVLVNTPETKHPKKGVEYFGKEASNFTKSQLTGKTVYLQKDTSDTDRYGRLLRYIWIERPSSDNPSNEEIKSKCFNAILLAGGYANVSTFPPDVKYVDLFRKIERQARDGNVGLWSQSFEINNGNKVPFEIDNGNKVSNKASNKVVNKKQNKPVQTSGQTIDANPKDKAYKYANGMIIANKNSGIYHVSSGRDYKKVSVKNAILYKTEQEAQNAGFRRAEK